MKRYVILSVVVGLGGPAAAATVSSATPVGVSSPAVTCESAPWPARANDAFTPNEKLGYAVKWGGMKAGRGTMEVQGVETMNGRPVYKTTLVLGTSGLAKKMVRHDETSRTWIDQASLLPVKAMKETRENSFSQDEAVTFDQGCKRFQRYEHRLDKNKETRKEGELPGETLDILGYLYYLRSLPLAEGGRYDVTLLSGERFWPVTVVVKQRLKIASEAGWFECYFLEPELRPGATTDKKLKELQVWVTADPRHIPVRLRMEANVGHITAELTSIENAK